ncbi:GMC family oxidoreductase N-terminal domain-containing protein [Streptomyces sp. SID13031]|uniref:GMC family oxidoreductase n=1 Tax=Streptomyces sp. SID13031 TaxID=2706046 RepID=UPI0013C75127|nr:GMC family oxidoreductase N-terminal domain-containing protein [Streptomyces sp. SID13031]NEA33615.1 choline dehydrogenase [Streptomyces sp. SID13031]
MYDYVIVGGGSAGCVLAARLSEDPDVEVCLVEAGPADTSPNIHVPAGAAKLFRTQLDWDYDSHQEPGCENRRIYLPRGRVLGGTSSINGMIYVRGNRLDYDSWRQPGWSYDELLPYFLRAEDNERGGSEFHGTGGPLAVSENRSRNPMSDAFIAAAIAAGHAANDDFNGPDQDGFGYYQLTQRDGMRCSSAAAYLAPVIGRPNLTIETGVQVHRVVIEGGRATGVTGWRADGEVMIRAAREVVLAAGAYNSPQLLMLSGIGPADLLTALGIPVVVDQPLVGQNLQDHPQFWLVYAHSRPVSLLVAGEQRYQQQFAEQHSGPLSSNGPEAGGFVRSRPELPAPDLQFVSLPVMFADGGLGFPSSHAISFGAYVLQPRSRGSVTLAGDDPTAKPRITHNYYADEADLRAATDGVRAALDIARQSALAPYTERPMSVPASESDTDIRDWLRRTTQTSYHAAGSCAMGLVTDSELRVLGADGLRVVDSSVMPRLISGNTNAPTIAIAEKAADLIRGVAPLPPAVAAAMSN